MNVVLAMKLAHPFQSIIRGLHVREFLNETFLDRWIGTNGPIPWPTPRSPNITPLNLVFGGLRKGIMTDLKQSMSNDVATADEAMLHRTWHEIENRLGAHIKCIK